MTITSQDAYLAIQALKPYLIKLASNNELEDAERVAELIATLERNRR